ncbi:MAG: ABC transporter ATP-binding protein [Sarcina sp.]
MKLYLRDVIGIPFRYTKFEAFIILVQKVFNGFVPMLQMFLVTDFVNKSVGVFNGKFEISKIYSSIFMLVGIIAIDWLFEKVILFASTSMSLKIKKGYRTKITKKVASLKYSCIESEDTWNLIARTSKDIEIRLRDAYLNLLNVVSLVLRVTGVLIVLLSYSVSSVVIMITICIPFFILSVKSGNKAYEVEKEVAKERRKSDYIGATLTSRECAYERNLFAYGDNLSDKWKVIYEDVRKKEASVNRKWIYRAKLGSVVTSIAVMLTIIIFLFPLANGVISIGNFVSIGNGTMGLINDMSWELSSFIQSITYDIEYFKDLRELRKLEEEKGSLELRGKSLELDTLEFKNVSFKYAGCENYIFNNLSFKIEKGKHYSIVGVNGSGKTTITKLITGLYSDFTGDILINGRSIKDYSSSEIKSLTAVVYQDFAKYYMSIKENIEIGNINKSEDASSLKEIEDAISIIGLDDFIDSLGEGILTTLGKVKEDSIDLSGGQWQRIAMARAIVSEANLRILDEPTSALDPISESKVYESFEDISKGKTTIFISHRLGSTKICDKIFVLSDGTLAEEGSHNELIALNGIYANMYEGQKEWYA